MVDATPRTALLRERETVPTLQYARWAPELIWKGAEDLPPPSPLGFGPRIVHLLARLYKNVLKNIYLSCLTLRRLMSYIYGAPILDVSRSHTMTQHSR